ncbi:HNH endonuclease signature motif containing protein [Allobranchiibius sp. GilTou38]|uniref:DUF222 domain-containing protein n=1 Tax=Allobranchiibius sp. GilTou38 TaxID=2815210 RepID=UPI001AA1391A|nr:DUF222 domain-containing protein [Allobranchiibius sp. GilTou38]
MGNPIDDNSLPQPAEIVPAHPGVGAGLMELLSAFAASMDAWPGALFQLSEADLGTVVSTMLTVVGRAENVAALATSDALTRGTVTGSTATGAPGWVAQVARGVDPMVVHRVGGVGRDCADPKNRVVAQCLAEGSASVPAAAVALREVPRVVRQLPCADRDDMFLRYLSLSHFGPRALKELSTRIIGQFAPEQLIRDEETQQHCEAARWYDLPGGMVRFEADLSAAHAATVKHALQFLSAPTPQTCPDNPAHSGDTAEEKGGNRGGNAEKPALGPMVNPLDRDPRTPAKRRADALLRLIETAAGVLDGTSPRPVGEITGVAKIVVTLDYNTLLAGLQHSGRLGGTGAMTDPIYSPGIGRTADGDYLDAGTLRRLACDADLIPMVLGGASEPMDVGRAKRLFTGGLRAAIIHRDRGCTFPDCDRPPDFCDAHHVDPWWTGGETTLTNAALLCTRHHTIVHRDLLTAAVTATGVTWDLTPGLMPHQRAG